MELKFRDLRADEVEVRIGTFKEGKGASLLLYKDARCDMNILDETVGAMNWQKRYSRDNANCIISIWDDEKKQWIEKEDTGTESKTEAEKGLASDAQKRSAFAWGIGRELYSSPFIWVNGVGKYDKFWVKEMTVENKKITELVICKRDEFGNKTDDVVFTFPHNRAKQNRMVNDTSNAKKSVKSENNAVQTISDEQAASIKSILEQTNSNVKAFLQNFKVNSVEEISAKDYPRAQRMLEQKVMSMEMKAQQEGLNV